jgi:hypothetical protein
LDRGDDKRTLTESSSMQDANAPYAAFVSHAKIDEKKAAEIRAALEARGLTCWIAP